MKLVLSANNIGSDIEFVLRGRSFICIMNNGDPRIDPSGTQCFSVHQSEKKIVVSVILLQLSVFC